jgi:TorA maturation chaperone TorD
VIGDRDLAGFRRDYYAVLVSLLWREPPAEVLRALRAGIEERAVAAASVQPLLGAGWTDVATYLQDTPAERLEERVADEFLRLFLAPTGHELNPYESFYLSGRVLDRPLAVLRGDLAALGIGRDATYAEPEDFLAFELDVMRRLVERQLEAHDADAESQWLTAQARFLTRHLLVWGPTAARDLGAAKAAVFYRGVARILEGWLAFEAGLFGDRGPEPPDTLDQARTRFMGYRDWRGPTFDDGAATDPADSPPPPFPAQGSPTPES